MEKIRRSESVKSYVKAMILIQGVMGKATRSVDNPYFKSKYADLETVNDCIHSATTEAKKPLLIQQYPSLSYRETKPVVMVTTRITEPESCEWEEFDSECTPVKDDPQAVGSAITYLRRYALMAAFNISPEDDDGNAGSDPMDQRLPGDRPRQNAGNAPRSQPNPRPPSAPQAQRPASRPPAQPQQQPSGVPTTGQVNQGLKTGAQVAGNQASITSEVITAEQFDALKGAAYKARVPIRQWKAWLKGLYGYEGSAEIKKTQYATILGILTKTPKVIINYGKGQDAEPPVESESTVIDGTLPEPEGN